MILRPAVTPLTPDSTATLSGNAPDSSQSNKTSIGRLGIEEEPGKDSVVASNDVPTSKSGTLATSRSAELWESLRGTTLAYSREGDPFFVPTSLLAPYGDPGLEPWFYPLPITPRQATLFLAQDHAEGCFLVYRPAGGESGTGRGTATYNLSVCRDGRGGRDVVHYGIVENVHGDVMVEGHDHSFMTVKELVVYFQRNKSSLATRLRRYGDRRSSNLIFAACYNLFLLYLYCTPFVLYLSKFCV